MPIANRRERQRKLYPYRKICDNRLIHKKLFGGALHFTSRLRRNIKILTYLCRQCKEDIVKMNENNEITLYQPDSSLKLEARLENETVWPAQAQNETGDDLILFTDVTQDVYLCIARRRKASDLDNPVQAKRSSGERRGMPRLYNPVVG
jgi:hypothetical protein